MFSSRCLSYRTLVYLWILTRGAEAQRTTVTCDRSFDWANNSKGQSPCLVAAYLQGQCYPDKQWNVTALPPGAQYTNQEANGCSCSSPVYSLLSACAACQGVSYATWGQWTANCPAGFINNGSFPFQVPVDTAMPQWALKSIGPQSYFDSELARGGGSGSLSGATVFLIVLLPILLVGIAGIAAWVWWQRRKRRVQSANQAGKEPLLRPAGSRQTIISLDTTSDIHIQVTRKSMESLHSHYGYDVHYAQPSPVPTTPESLGYSSHPSPALSSPGAQYAHYPEFSGHQPNQPFLAPPSAATSLGFAPQYHSSAPTPPHTASTAQTFASQMQANAGRQSSDPVVVENDSGTFPRTPVEPALPTLPLGDMRRLLPPSVRANEQKPQ
ncbi:putative transmembrane protein [Rhizoctonia solani 123E]|uniref:Putative transmembrane protein n=1 Tax=Rhizoctonia solani 123E TaxID=1423351 RepID=A0A074RG69_9AGAM|nr:putative transmembrane protein [Rhizoctonia solani 123E]